MKTLQVNHENDKLEGYYELELIMKIFFTCKFY